MKNDIVLSRPTLELKENKKMAACMNGAFLLKMKQQIFIKLNYKFLKKPKPSHCMV